MMSGCPILNRCSFARRAARGALNLGRTSSGTRRSAGTCSDRTAWRELAIEKGRQEAASLYDQHQCCGDQHQETDHSCSNAELFKSRHGPPQTPTVSIKKLISRDVCPAIDSDNRFNMQRPN